MNDPVANHPMHCTVNTIPTGAKDCRDFLNSTGRLVFRAMRKIQHADAELYQAIFTHRFCGRAFFIMWGAPSQIDLFDPKPFLVKHHGEPIPEAIARDANFAFVQKEIAILQGSPFRFQAYGKSGIDLSELLPNLGRCVDDMTVIRTTHTDSFNHRPGEILMNTGFPRLGRPSMGSWLQYGLGSPSRDLPSFVVLCSGSEVDGGSSQWSSAVFALSIYIWEAGTPISI